MEYRKYENTIIARLDKGEEILTQLKKIALREKVTLASISAIGAVNDITLGVFKTAEKQYHANNFKGNFEIVSFTGTISTMNHEYYAHIHMSAGNEEGNVFGGHLNHAVVSATCEMIIQVIHGEIDRAFCEEIGLNLIQFQE